MTAVGNPVRDAAVALYDRYTHQGLDRRAFMAEMTRIAGGTAAAAALVAAIAASPTAAAIVSEDDPRLSAREQRFSGTDWELAGYQAHLRIPASQRPFVMVVHENRGLNAHIRDVARRLALDGYTAFAPDFLGPGGGTPADGDAARAMIAKLDYDRALNAARQCLAQVRSGGGKVGAVGFCWGGAFVNRLAVTAGKDLDAGVVFYGTAPSGAEAPRVETPLLIHLAGRDERVNKSALPWVVALRNAGKSVRAVNYQDVDHAFHNDTSAERYNKAAADRAWKTTLAFFKQHLG